MAKLALTYFCSQLCLMADNFIGQKKSRYGLRNVAGKYLDIKNVLNFGRGFDSFIKDFILVEVFIKVIQVDGNYVHS